MYHLKAIINQTVLKTNSTNCIIYNIYEVIVTIWNDRIKALREDADLNQTEMGKILKISQNAISKYENAERSVPIETLIQYAKYFNVSLDYLCGLE